MLGRYELLREIAMGGMAKIHIAKHRTPGGLEKLLVVKSLLPELATDAAAVQMFLEEAKLAARLSHPNVVQIFDLGCVQGTYFIAMEYIHGEDLATILQTTVNRGASIPLGFAMKIASQACEALHYAHTKADVSGRSLGVVHRDVSPQNIVVSFGGMVKLVDFGIAKAASRRDIDHGQFLVGKLAYMAPEQYEGGDVDARTDVFALGIVLWEVVTGRRLFGQYEPEDMITVITQTDATSPIEFNNDIPLDLDGIILKALARDPAKRFQSAYEMYTELEDCMRHEGVLTNTLQIGSWMQKMFAHKLESVRRIEQAQAAGVGLESFLFDDLFEGSSPLDDLAEGAEFDPSKPITLPSMRSVVPEPPAALPAPARRPGRRRVLLLFLLLLTLAGSLGFFYRAEILALVSAWTGWNL
jgi:serine/threonine-protein kinase